MLGTVAMTTDCATRSGGAATRDDAEADGGPQNTRARTGGMQDVHSKVTAGAGVGNVNMLQQLPHFLMLCGAATERKTGIATLLPGEDVMRLNMANAFFVRYRGREALQRGLKRYDTSTFSLS